VSVRSFNFAFLERHDPGLVKLGGLAEHFFPIDPSSSLIKLRQFAETLSRLVAAYNAMFVEGRESFDETLRRLTYERAVPRQAIDLFHHLRKVGNRAVHEAKGSHEEALSALKLAHQLAIWFHRAYGRDKGFAPGAFVPPAAPRDPTVMLRGELAALRERLLQAEDAAARARREAEELAEARASVEERLRGEAEERARWERVAQEVDAEKAALEARLKALQAEAAAAPAAAAAEIAAAETEAAHAIDLDEADTRALIDRQLRDRGWQADSVDLRHAAGARPIKGVNRAIAEWPTAKGPADYALFVGLRLVGVVEAKRKRKNVSAAIDQAERYAKAIAGDDSIQLPPGGPWHGHAVPFVFATNGRPFLRQLETESGIWFRDTRREANHRRALDGWPSPDGLAERLEVDVDAATAALARQPFEFGFPLRDYQRAAIEAVEAALAEGRRAMLVAMATGTGKTKLSIAMLFRLLAAKRFRRVCFVVDRSLLGDQSAREFQTTKIVTGKAFADIFGLKGLEDVAPDDDTRVHICTIQGLVRRVLYQSDPADAPAVDQYDLMVIDECHRGYLLDREMSDAELAFRGQDDYVSKYRRVLDYFDAVKIGLTATPAQHTAEIFGKPVFKYSYRDAVLDGYLIDHEPPVRITTALAEAGIRFQKDTQIDLLNTRTGEIDLATAPDDLNFEVEQFNRKVVTRAFNRVVAEELARHIDPAIQGKTLVFAATDAHADIVVAELKTAFAAAYGAIEDKAVKKITGSVDDPKNLTLAFRNDADPRVAVTVDLLTTGIDAPRITNLVFLRRVSSRILYDQMIGRATRLCPEIGKEVFRIFDAVELYPHLQNLTEMRPVAVDPSIAFEQLVAELLAARTAEAEALIREQLTAKLSRRLKRMGAQAREQYETVAGEAPEATLKRLRRADAAELKAWLGPRAQIGRILDWRSDDGTPSYVPISYHDDSIVSVTRGFGSVDKPEDYLDGFAKFVRENVNRIAALTVVVQRPRDLTRADLKALRRALDDEGFSEASLRRAWADASNADIAASLIGFVRQAALGDPLVPYAERVAGAMRRLLARGDWTEPQRRWLARIGEQVAKEIVVDRAALDQEPFAADGGYGRLDRIFGGRLETVLSDLNEELWARTG
jgi:type I restriction enzyme R subunit